MQREPEYHFIIDCSADEKSKIDDHLSFVDDFIEQNNIDRENIEYVLTNSGFKRLSGEVSHTRLKTSANHAGGCYVDRAIKSTIIDNYMNMRSTYPVIIVVTDQFDKAVILEDNTALQFAYPDDEHIYYTDKFNQLKSYSLVTQTSKKVNFEDIHGNQNAVLAYSNDKRVQCYLLNNGSGTVVKINKENSIDNSWTNGNKWVYGVMLDAMDMDIVMRVGDVKAQRLAMVKGSIQARVMSPLTAFIVLERESQEEEMLQKQR